MNIEKNQFESYLKLFQKKMGITKNSNLKISELSKEFLAFLKKENADISLSGLSISDILEQGIYDMMSKEEDGELASTGDNNKDFFAAFLNSLFKNTNLKDKMDADKNGTIDKEEFSKFLSIIDENQDSNITVEELFGALDKMRNENVDSSTLTSAAPVSETPSNSAGPTSTSNGNQSYSAPSIEPDNANNLQQKSLENMTYDELVTEQGTRKDTLKKAEDNLQDVYSGNTEAIASAQKNYDSAKENYDEAVKNDETISAELKKEKDDNLAAISEQENEVKTINTTISQNETKIFDLGQSIDELSSKINGLNSAYDTLKDSDDENTQKQVDKMKSSIERQKAAAEREIKELKTEKDRLESETDKLKNTDLKEAEAKLTELNDTRKEIEANILANCGQEVKDALKVFDSAKDALDGAKRTSEASAKNAITQAREALTEVNGKVNEEKAKQIKKENSLKPSLADEPFGKVDKYNAEWIENETSAPFMIVAPEGIENYQDIPVVVCYPGSGGICSGKNAQLNNQNSFTRSIMEQAGENAPMAIFVVMQTNHTNNWTNGKENVTQYTREALQYVKDNYDINENNISATGHSLGGDGVRYVAQQEPSLFKSGRLAAISPSTSIGGNINNSFLSKKFDVQIYSGWRDSDGCYSSSVWLAKNFYGSYVTSGGGHGDAIKAAMQHTNDRNRKNDMDKNELSDFFEHLLLGKHVKRA